MAVVVASCTATSETAAEGACADVDRAEIEAIGSAFTVRATVVSADTGWDKYADAWEVRTLDGTVLATRVLTHPHVDEQPFTRSLDNVAIPDHVDRVEVAAHDSVEGFCGETVIVAVPRG